MNFLIYREYKNFSGIWQVGIVHVVADTPSQVPTACTIDRVANMHPNEGVGPSIFSTPLASAYLPRLAETTLPQHRIENSNNLRVPTHAAPGQPWV